MPKALFFGLPLAGHTNPSLPLVRELTARGTRILYFSTDAFADRIEATGAEYRPYRNAFLNDLRQLPERTDQLSWLLTEATADLLERELAALRTERPDYVITDSVAPWGQWIGQLLEVPVVTSTSTFAINRQVLTYAVSQGIRPRSSRAVMSKLRHIAKALGLSRRLRRRYGVPGTTFMGMVFGQSRLNVVYTSRTFQPCAETFDDRFLFVGPSISSRAEIADFRWEELTHPVLVYVSLGTLFNTDAAFFRHCLEALGPVDCQVVVSLGQQVQIADLGPVPAQRPPAARSASARRAPPDNGVRHPRRHEQRQRELVFRRADGRRAADVGTDHCCAPGRGAWRWSASGQGRGKCVDHSTHGRAGPD